MHRDELCELPVGIEELGRPCGSRHGAIEGTGTLRVDRAHSAGRFDDGAAVVALSAAERWGAPRAIGGH